MTRKILHIAFLLTAFAFRAAAQLSPGELAKPHAHLEGMMNCTKCHVLGSKVSNDKCLSCHKEIKDKIAANAGYHAARDVKAKECASCHSDHHGRNFDMVRFDKDKFNHSLSGYELTGAHKTTDCRKCHKPEFVGDAELKKRPNTYLGLQRDCKSCHADYHQNTLSTDCAQCHTTDKFTPAGKFDHNKTDFALLGQHKTVTCAECHKKETRNGKAFQQFSGVPFGNCNSCHADPHHANLGANCKECHVEQSFTALTGLKKFNHNQTHFPLKGKHQQVDCAGCHSMVATPLKIFQDKLGIQTSNCAACHKDVHEGKFGANCADCHQEKSFEVVGIPKNFNHNTTGYELAGKHQGVDCRKCHISERYTDPLRHFYCTDCHKDYHEGQLASIIGISPDCAACHTVDGFETSQYSIEQHQKAKFPLDGAHLATPCIACHQAEPGKWKFRNVGMKCADCHTDVHQGYIDPKFYPEKTCERCHGTNAWEESRFDHTQTKFRLLGAHNRQACMACHGKKDDAGKLPQRYQKFSGLDATCTACHENVHRQQFEKNGATNCLQCHAYEDWKAVKFDHNKTAFKLDGKHVNVACSGCHKETLIDGRPVVQYKLASFKCIDCHH